MHGTHLHVMQPGPSLVDFAFHFNYIMESSSLVDVLQYKSASFGEKERSREIPWTCSRGGFVSYVEVTGNKQIFLEKSWWRERWIKFTVGAVLVLWDLFLRVSMMVDVMF
ncbi:hypothetical protein Syun_001753 [Stephania yunnanensis]|uniref:Uncharacterized protein n=1 Tax=Stephania yunnanensis TaxID=152371 RepID=A0AAP0Q7E8_9MAGN